MSSFAIRIEPPIGPAEAPVSQSWIDSIDWDAVTALDGPAPEYTLVFQIDDQWLEFTSQSLAGVLRSLVDIREGILGDSGSLIIVEGVDVIMARRFGAIVQFAELLDWERSPTELPEQLNPDLVGDPISSEVVDQTFRHAIAAVWQQLHEISVRH